MIIKSVKINNFKKHDSFEFKFGEGINLIGGPNEAGKSTIVEAIHAALFFRHTSNAAELKALKSISNPGNPQVALKFEVNGQEYELIKSFLGGGSCELKSPGQIPLLGIAAEQELGRILKSQAPTGGPAQAKGEWAHLWVWQGQAGENPVPAMAHQQQNLFNQFAETGVQIPMASAKDQEVFSSIKSEFDETFTPSGKIGANSLRNQIESSYNSSVLALETITEKIQSLQAQSERYSALENQLKEKKEALDTLEKDRDTLNEKLKLLEELEQQTNEAKTTLDNLITQEESIRKMTQRIQELDEEDKKIENKIAALQKQIVKYEEELRAFDVQIKAGKADLDKLQKRMSGLQTEVDYCGLLLTEKIKGNDLERIENRLGAIVKIEEGITSARNRLDALPNIDQEKIDSWVELTNKVSRYQGVLEAIATEIEVLNETPLLTHGDAPLSGKVRFTEEAILNWDGREFLKIIPGGGKNLEQANEDYRAAKQELIAFIRSLGISEFAEAQKIVIQRNELIKTINLEEARLGGMDPKNDLLQSQSRLKDELKQLKLRLNTLLTEAPELNALVIADYDQHLQDSQQTLAGISAELKEKRQELEFREIQVGAINEKIQQEKETLNQSRINGIGTTIELNLLREQLQAEHIDLDEIVVKRAEQEERYKSLNVQVIAMEPETLRMKEQRIIEAIEINKSKQSEITGDLRQLQGYLEQSGNEDVHQNQQQEFAKKEALRIQKEGVERETEAIKLLKELFDAEQQEMANNYAVPLAEKIQYYLQFIFGQGVNVQLSSGGNGQFNGLKIYREQQSNLGPIDFDKLSGGTKEQIAAAVRLAMAEVLAPDYGGHLPIVFDDAFAYSDGERLEALSDMLYAAARRGIQVILLSCTPNDYSGLGAHQYLFPA